MVNHVDNLPELEDRLAQLRHSSDQRKVLFVHCGEGEEFQKRLDEVLAKVAKVERQNVIVIKTRNLELLRSLKIEPDRMATTRLINLHKKQPPLFEHQSYEHEFFSRCKPLGPFQFEALCEFIHSPWKEYYESKSGLSLVKTVTPE